MDSFETQTPQVVPALGRIPEKVPPVAAPDIHSLDLFGEAFYQDPYPWYEQLQKNAPVFWSEQMHHWLVTRYEDVMKVLTTPETFSSNRCEYLIPTQFTSLMKDWIDYNKKGVFFMDPPVHTAHRPILNAIFSPEKIRNMRGAVESVVDRYIEVIKEKGDFDFTADFAHNIPVDVICDLFSVPAADRATLKQKMFEAGKILSMVGNEEVYRIGQQSMFYMRDYFTTLIREKILTPDLVEKLKAEETENNDIVTITVHLINIIFAAHETTKGLISNGMSLLYRYPEQKKLLIENPRLVRSAASEMLRFDTPFQGLNRVVVRDTELHGKHLKAGDAVFFIMAAANRDPSRFENADQFDITRKANAHLSFGAGIHRCAGEHLAYLEAIVSLEKLLPLLPRLEFTGDKFYWQVGNATIRGLEQFPMRLMPIYETETSSSIR